MSGHSLNGPSSFARRRACPGSARMEKDLPDSASIYAMEGTAGHELGEKCLKNGNEPAEFLGDKIKVVEGDIVEYFEVDGEMVDAVTTYVEYCTAIIAEADHILIEEKLALPFLGQGTKGTGDFIGLTPKILHVVDYKHGKGVPVEAIGNIQGLCYGLGAAEKFKHADWEILRITIVQPRAYHALGPVRSWDVKREDLFDWMLEFGEIALLTDKPDAPLRAGSHCKFCKANKTCAARAQYVEEAADMDFSEPSSKPIPIEMLSDQQIKELVLEKIPVIEAWCKNLKDYAQQRAEEGNALPGTKLVHTRSSRYWADEKKAQEVFGHLDGAYDKKFKSAAGIEKLIGKKKFGDYEHLVEKKQTGVTLVEETDPRPNARPSAESMFGSVL